MTQVAITKAELEQLNLKSEPPKKCFNCKWNMERMDKEYGVGFLQFGDFFQCPHCNAINGNRYAMENTKKVRAFLRKKADSRILAPNGSKIID